MKVVFWVRYNLVVVGVGGHGLVRLWRATLGVDDVCGFYGGWGAGFAAYVLRVHAAYGESKRWCGVGGGLKLFLTVVLIRVTPFVSTTSALCPLVCGVSVGGRVDGAAHLCLDGNLTRTCTLNTSTILVRVGACNNRMSTTSSVHATVLCGPVPICIFVSGGTTSTKTLVSVTYGGVCVQGNTGVKTTAIIGPAKRTVPSGCRSCVHSVVHSATRTRKRSAVIRGGSALCG